MGGSVEPVPSRLVFAKRIELRDEAVFCGAVVVAYIFCVNRLASLDVIVPMVE